MKLKIAVIAAASALALNAHATDTIWGTHDPIFEFSGPNFVSGSFNDSIFFSLPAALNLLFNTTVSNNNTATFSIKDGLVSLYADGAVSDTFLGSFPFTGATGVSSHEFAPVSGGDYFYRITGVANGTSGGLYNVTSTVTTPVPEPQTYALLLAGLGVIGFVARRRRPQA